MNWRKTLSLAIASVMVLSVFLVATPVSAQQTSNDTLKIIMMATQGSLFGRVFNPSPNGITGISSYRVWMFLSDVPYSIGPDGHYHPYRCTLISVQNNVKVPDDAIIWNGTQKKWVAPYAGKTALSAVTWKCGLGQWQDGQPITLADFLFDYAMLWEWSFQNGKNDKFYADTYAGAWQGTLKDVLGLKVDSVSNDYIEYTLYQNYSVPFSKWSTAVGNFVEYPSLPWELYNVLSQAVAYGIDGKTFTWAGQPQNGFEVDMISSDQAPYYAKEAQYLMNNQPIPIWLSTLNPWLQKWGISAEQAGITESLAKAGYQAIINWANTYHNVIISNGPYYVYKYNPKALTLILKRANIKRIGFPGTITINGKTYKVPWNPYWKEIDIYGTLNQQTAILAVAKGYYDFFWASVPYNQLQTVMQKYGKNLKLVKSVATWLSLDLNLVGNPKTGLVNASGKVVFNPFALRGVRYAMNFLVSRSFIISNILQGSAAPLFGPIATGQVNASIAMQIVANALGITTQSNEPYALKLINQAMNNAAKNLKPEGYTLEQKNGKWYFGKTGGTLYPVTIRLIAPVNDPQRLNEGKYIAQLLEKAGFTVDLIKATGRQTHIVHHSDPRVLSGNTLRWDLYTEGWISTSIHSILSIAWHLWVFDYYIAPNRGADYHDPVTLQDLVNNISSGNLENFIKTLDLQYYNTPDKLKPLLDWSAYDFAMVLAYNTWDAHGVKVSITNIKQFWDLYKLGYGCHILDSPHVYIAKVYTFFLLTKKIKLGVVDPVTGIGSFFAQRSIMPATGVPTSSTTTSTSSTSTTSTTTTTHTTSTTTTTTSTTTSTATHTATHTTSTTHTTSKISTTSSTSSTSSSSTSSTTSTTSSKKKSICGPAAIVGLALLPLLLRRKRR